MINIHSKTSKQKCYIIVATNTYKKGSICNDIKYIIRQTMSTSKTQCLAPFLKIYKGMKIIIIENLYPELGIVNGNIGYIENISLTYSKWI
jgi:ATP-dependent exoDNAse (exonuclease V) alpha subunit